MDEFEIDDHSDGPKYRELCEFDGSELPSALRSLHMLGDHPYLSTQSFNLGVVDMFITQLEYHVLKEYHREERAPETAVFLAAQSQMWIFAAYELMRTWRGRARDAIKLHETGGLGHKIAALRKDVGFLHTGRQMYADQLAGLINSPTLVARLRDDLRITHIPFGQHDLIRVALAKHEVKGKRNSIANGPGYGRINQECGSLDYEMEVGRVVIGYISRRDIADGLRAVRSRLIPSDEDLKSFEQFMNPPEIDF